MLFFTGEISTGSWVLFIGLLVIVIFLFFIPERLNEFFNDHRWVLPAVAFVLMVAVTVEVRGFVHALHEDEISSCERNNDARVASIREKERDIELSLEPALELWEGAIKASGIDPSTPPRVVELFDEFLAKLRRGIITKERGIQQAIEAQEAVALEPRSPIPARRSVVDCAKAFG